MQKTISTPLTQEVRETLSCGDRCLLTGTILTARDAAHERLVKALQAGEKLPIDLRDAIIYYVGPCRARDGQVIGAAGPTTSGRMDEFTPYLLQLGLAATIGKGRRNAEVIDAMQRHGAVYFAATGGAGALLAQRVKSMELLLYPDLGPEAVYRLQVEDFPVIVAIDSAGNDIYDSGPGKWSNEQE